MVRFALSAAVLLCWTTVARAGTIVLPSETTPGDVITDAANNDDYEGELGDNPNYAHFVQTDLPSQQHPSIANLEGIFTVLDSGGTTEYFFEIQTRTPDSQWNDIIQQVEGYVLQIGFGIGENFVSASGVFADLDLDAPLPSDPEIPAEIGALETLMSLDSHESDTLTWNLHETSEADGMFSTGFFQFPLDVPDLPESAMDYYQDGDLPADFPEGAKAFTVRGYFQVVPEPSAGISMLLAAGGTLMVLRRRTGL